MSLQRRLTVFFVVIVIMPLGVAGLALHNNVVARVEDDETRLRQTAVESASGLYQTWREVIGERLDASVTTRPFIGELVEDYKRVRLVRSLRELLEDAGGTDYVAAVSADGRILGSVVTRPEFSSHFEVPTVRRIVRGGSVGGPGFFSLKSPFFSHISFKTAASSCGDVVA